MGRKKINCVYNYYEISGTTAKCLVCEKSLKSLHGTNLMKHLRCAHPDIHELVVKRNAALSEDDSSVSSPSTSKKPKSETNVLLECVKLTTVHGRPFALIDDQAFQNIIGLIPGQKKAVNSANVKKCVIETASELRNYISNEIKSKLISLKVDAATLGTRCFLGINIQYGLEDKIWVKNLGVIELYARHTSEYLAENVIDNLKLFGLQIDQIYCCTTDNGANMLKITTLLQDKFKALTINYTVDVSDKNTNSDDDNDTDSMEDDDEYSVDPEIFQNGLDTALSSSLQQENDNILTIRCAAHTLQLAVRDACKDENTQSTINLVRTVVKKLRSQNCAMFLKANDKRKPLLDCQTRWCSTFDMVERFLDYKEVLSGEPGNNLYFPPQKWPVLDLLLKSLKPSKVLTKILLTEQLTMSDFYGYWLKCELETSEIDTNLSRKILEHMRERQKILFANDAIISAIYLDPRYNAILTRDQQAAARRHLVKIYQRIILLENRTNE